MGKPRQPMYSVEFLNSNMHPQSVLKVIEYSGSMVKCLCECGKTSIVQPFKIKNGTTKSCGCKMAYFACINNLKYSTRNRKIYSSWHGMISRCYDPKNSRYKNYGARGVTVCNEWRDNYENFLSWSLANGWQAGLQIDKDVKGDGMVYCPENCSWVTPKKNANNRTNNVKFEFRGGLYTLSEIAEIFGVKRDMIRHQVQRRHKSLDEALKYLGLCG